MTNHLTSVDAAQHSEGQFASRPDEKLRSLITWAVVVGLGACFAGTFLIISSQPITIATIVFVVALGIGCWPIAAYFPGNIERGLLFALASTLSISLKKHLFFRTDHMGGAIGLRISITDILLLLLLAVLAFRLKTNRRIRIQLEKPVLLAFSAYLGIAVLSASLGNSPQLGFFELCALVQSFLLLVFLRNFITKPDRYKIFVAGLLAGLVLQSGIAIVQDQRPGLLNLQFLGAGEQQEVVVRGGRIALPDVDVGVTLLGGQVQERPTGLLIHPNVLASYLVLTIPVAIAALLVLETCWLQVLSAVALPLSVTALYFTLSRSGWAGLTAAVAIAVFLWRLWKPFRLSVGKKIGLALITVALICGVALKAGRIYQRLTETFQEAISFRMNLASTAWNMVKAHPFVGVGLNSYETVVQQFDESMISRIKVYPVHNLLLLELSETGMFGGIAFVALWLVTILCMFAACRRAVSPFSRVVGLFSSCGMVGFFFTDMTGFAYRIPVMTSMVWAQVALALCADQVVQPLGPSGRAIDGTAELGNHRG
jgi:putative inorganic carbon (HCO3(-)) transporter